MTRREKHALIERAIFGREWVSHEYVVINGVRGDIRTWLPASESPDRPGGGTTWGEAPPDYSSDLNLCARAEAKIAEMGKIVDYIRCLSDAARIDLDYTERDLDYTDMSSWEFFLFITASASARVDAMVAMIQKRDAK